eukprot:gene19058-33332_t
MRLPALCIFTFVPAYGQRTVTLDTSNSQSQSPDPANVFTFGGGAASWASLLPSGEGYMKDIRTGNPGSEGTLQVKEVAVGQGDYLVSIAFTFAYVIGFCSDARCT